MARPLKLLGNVVFALLALAICGVFVGLTIMPQVLRYQTYVVLSGSMEPAIPVGAVVVAQAVDPSSLEVGDVVTYVRAGDQENVTHRIISIKGDAKGRSFVTKGDASGAADLGEIRYDRLAGKVTLSVPYLGYFFKFVGSPSSRLLFIVVPGLLLLGSWLWEIWKPESKPRAPADETPASLTPAVSASVVMKHQPRIDVGVGADAAAVPLRQ